ncbi:MAG: hypothetical protein QNI87_00490 [Erythrobacter sp.]|uniref:hypothetical protein n=1 Tax=Erythrobacter sp. TaxID=1042 RepID=UPI002613B301|nr:hypothetical protein [Erythrobacter sp.]MDJ0976994.1 hypothetical protein [Erythrobacter sp.]
MPAPAFAEWTALPAPCMFSARKATAMQSDVVSWFLKMDSLPMPFQGGISPQWKTLVKPIAEFAWFAVVHL